MVSNTINNESYNNNSAKIFMYEAYGNKKPFHYFLFIFKIQFS